MSDNVLATSRGFVHLAGLVWFLYDYLLSLDDEVEHIWFRKPNFSTLLYLSSRLTSFGVLVIGVTQGLREYAMTEQLCDVFHWIEGVGTMLVFVNTQIVLQYRIWAIYNRSRRMLFVNGALFLVELAVAVVLMALFYAHQELADVEPLPGLGLSCVAVPQREMSVIFCGVLAYELYLAILAVVCTIQVSRIVAASGHRTITEVVAFDSLVYFVLIMLSCFAVIILWTFAPVSPGNAAVAFTRAAGGIGACRLILHIKREARAREEQSDGVGVTLQFANDAERECSEVKFVQRGWSPVNGGV